MMDSTGRIVFDVVAVFIVLFSVYASSRSGYMPNQIRKCVFGLKAYLFIRFLMLIHWLFFED